MEMVKKYRYVLNMGLAFDEGRVLKRFCELAKQGWSLKEMSLFRYKLVKDQPRELIYSMDYKNLDKHEDDYFELFKNTGWQHMCSYGPYHFFSAAPGTVPIYTDRESYLSKYKSSKDVYFKSLIISCSSLLIIALIGNRLSDNIISSVVKNVLLILGTISAAIALPSFMVTAAYFIKERRRFKI